MHTQTRNAVISPVVPNGLRRANLIRLLDGSIFDRQADNDLGDPAFDFSFSSFPVIPALVNVDFGEIMATWHRTQHG